MKKRIAYLFMACIVIFALTGCKSEDKTAKTDSNASTEASASPSADASTTDSATADASSTEPVALTISAAASLQNSLDEIKTLYETANPNVTLTFNYGGSGALQQQIEQGAPTDIFMSAANKQMTALKDGGLMVDDTISTLLKNKVVLIVPKDSTLGITSFEDITKAKVIALGDPASVPAGQYAEQIFTSLGNLDKVKEKVTYGKDVTEVLTWIGTGNADAGVVYQTDAQSSADVTVVAEAPEGSCDDVVYPVGVVKASKEADAAKAFLDYLKTDEAMQIFIKNGFIKGE